MSKAWDKTSLVGIHGIIKDFEPSSPKVRNSLLFARMEDTGEPRTTCTAVDIAKLRRFTLSFIKETPSQAKENMTQ
ncbi:hypothetical protein D3C84_1021950 [compost metagenome]